MRDDITLEELAKLRNAFYSLVADANEENMLDEEDSYVWNASEIIDKLISEKLAEYDVLLGRAA